MIYSKEYDIFSLCENEIKKPSPEGEGGPLAVDEV